MSQSFLRNLGNNMQNVYKFQEQLSTMKQVNRPSDDPLKVAKILNFQNDIKQNNEYKNTINDAIDFTNMQDASLGNATSSMQRIYTLTQQAANSSYNHDDRQAIKSEIESEVESLMDALNTSYGGKNIFGGKNTTTQPFEVTRDENGQFTGIQYNGTTDPNDSGNLSKEIARGVFVDLRTDGRQVFNEQGTEAEPDNLGTFFSDLFTALDNDDTEALGGDLLGRLDRETTNIINYRAQIGATHNRLESARDRNEAEYLNLETTLSNTQDIDLAETYMKYAMEMVAYDASLAMGTRILQSNVLDYLR